MKHLKVSILASNPLFAQGLASFLKEENGLEITTLDATEPQMISHVDTRETDVILFESETDGSRLTIEEILREHPNIMIVSLNLQDNTMNLYYSRKIAEAKAEDLKKAILSWGRVHRVRKEGPKTIDFYDQR